MKKNSPRRVLLTVDLTTQDASLTLRVWNALKPLIQAGGTTVEPISVLGRDAAIDKILSSQVGNLAAATEKRLAERLADLGLKNLADPKILFAKGSSTEQMVAALLNYAGKTGCDLIAVSSHSRKGFKRLLLGSFSETVSLKSSIPLLVVNANQRAETAKYKTILYATDFSDQSKRGLEMVCETFRDLKPKIVLFHSYLLPVQIYLEPFASSPLPQSVIKQGIAQMDELGQSWCAQLRADGFACKFVMNKRSPFVAQGILSAIQREKAGLVAMVSKSGRVGAAILGSAAREVLRNSPRPVWVVHP